MKNVTLNIKITGMAKYKTRQFIAVKLMKLAALFLGCEIKISINMLKTRN